VTLAEQKTISFLTDDESHSVNDKKGIQMKTLLLALVAGITLSAWASLDDGLIAYYPLDGNAADYSGSGLNGSIVQTSFTDGLFDESGLFNGHSSYIKMKRGQPMNFRIKDFQKKNERGQDGIF
jgi:hypothetical protein